MCAQQKIYKFKDNTDIGLKISVNRVLTLNMIAVMVVRSEQYELEEGVEKYQTMSLSELKRIAAEAIISFGIDNPPYYIGDNDLEKYVEIIETRLKELTDKRGAQ